MLLDKGKPLLSRGAREPKERVVDKSKRERRGGTDRMRESMIYMQDDEGNISGETHQSEHRSGH